MADAPPPIRSRAIVPTPERFTLTPALRLAGYVVPHSILDREGYDVPPVVFRKKERAYGKA